MRQVRETLPFSEVTMGIAEARKQVYDELHIKSMRFHTSKLQGAHGISQMWENLGTGSIEVVIEPYETESDSIYISVYLVKSKWLILEGESIPSDVALEQTCLEAVYDIYLHMPAAHWLRLIDEEPPFHDKVVEFTFHESDSHGDLILEKKYSVYIACKVKE